MDDPEINDKAYIMNEFLLLWGNGVDDDNDDNDDNDVDDVDDDDDDVDVDSKYTFELYRATNLELELPLMTGIYEALISIGFIEPNTRVDLVYDKYVSDNFCDYGAAIIQHILTNDTAILCIRDKDDGSVHAILVFRYVRTTSFKLGYVYIEFLCRNLAIGYRGSAAFLMRCLVSAIKSITDPGKSIIIKLQDAVGGDYYYNLGFTPDGIYSIIQTGIDKPRQGTMERGIISIPNTGYDANQVRLGANPKLKPPPTTTTTGYRNLPEIDCKSFVNNSKGLEIKIATYTKSYYDSVIFEPNNTRHRTATINIIKDHIFRGIKIPTSQVGRCADIIFKNKFYNCEVQAKGITKTKTKSKSKSKQKQNKTKSKSKQKQNKTKSKSKQRK